MDRAKLKYYLVYVLCALLLSCNSSKIVDIWTLKECGSKGTHKIKKVHSQDLTYIPYSDDLQATSIFDSLGRHYSDWFDSSFLKGLKVGSKFYNSDYKIRVTDTQTVTISGHKYWSFRVLISEKGSVQSLSDHDGWDGIYVDGIGFIVFFKTNYLQVEKSKSIRLVKRKNANKKFQDLDSLYDFAVKRYLQVDCY